ncbi:MAG: leucine-rich repeat protein [Firmicutes bacterium]|nr:leucine-rich repeat protein [Bacillota bacterium]
MKKIVLLAGLILVIGALLVSGVAVSDTANSRAQGSGMQQLGLPRPIYIVDQPEYFTYEQSGLYATITGLDTAALSQSINIEDYNLYLDIPSTISALPTLTVNNIANMAFRGDSAANRGNIIGVTLPNTIHTVGSQAFANNIIETLYIPDSVTALGGLAFMHNNLTHIDIPGSVTNFGVDMFLNNRLTSVNIGEGVTQIPQQTFANNFLPSIVIPSTVTNIGVGAFMNNDLASIIIPDGVTMINNSAFFNNDISGALILPAGLVEVGANAFRGNNIETLVFPESIAVVAAGAFGDNALTSVTFPAGSPISTISQVSFMNNFLTSIQLPNNVTNIGYMAFSNNLLGGHLHIPHGVVEIQHNAFATNSITTVSFPDTLITIGPYAFQSNDLTSVDFPSSVTTIGANSFRMNDIDTVVLTNNITTLGEWAFWNNNLTSVQIPNTLTVLNAGIFADNDITSVIIPESVTQIDRYVFARNDLTQISIPNAVTSIGENAFVHNPLATIAIPNSVVTMGMTVFTGNPNNATIFIQHSAVPSTWPANWRNAANTLVLNAIPRPTITATNSGGSITGIDPTGEEIDWAMGVTMTITNPNGIGEIEVNGQVISGTDGRLNNDSAAWTLSTINATTVTLALTLIGHDLDIEVRYPTFDITLGANVTTTGGLTGVPQGTQRTLTANPDPGWNFTHWTTTSGTIASPNEVTTLFTLGSANATVTAHFQAYFTLNGVETDITSTIYEIGHLTSLAYQTGYRQFLGWGTTASMALSEYTALTPGMILIPVWQDYVTVNGVRVNITAEVAIVADLTPPANQAGAREFLGWNVSDVTPLLAGMTITPRWQEYVTANGARVNLTPEVNQVNHLERLERDGYIFLGWSLDGETLLAGSHNLVAGMVLEAMWNEVSRDIWPWIVVGAAAGLLLILLTLGAILWRRRTK